jgi:hypothetical protein
MGTVSSGTDSELVKAVCGEECVCHKKEIIAPLKDDKLREMDLSNSMLYATIGELIRKVNLLIEQHNQELEDGL